MHNYKVYKYSFPDGKAYIGVTAFSLEYRRDCGYGHNQKLKEAIRKYGWNGFTHEILYENLSREEAFEKEMLAIKELETNIEGKGYNVSVGGKAPYLGLKHTDEFCKRMSEMNKGKVFSKETLVKMAQAQKKKGVEACDESGKAIKRFRSLHEAASYIEGYPTNIARACNENKAYKGMMWRYIEGGDLG